jgi:signal peptidase I
MKKKSEEKNAAAAGPEESALVPSFMGYIGPFAAVLGLFVMQRVSTARPGTLDWLWYIGLVLTLAGAVAWLTAGMNRSQVFEWSRSGLIALALALAIRWAVAEPYRIPSGSMENTLHGDPGFGRGDRVFVNKWVYGIRVPFMNKRLYQGQDVKRWDIVVFKTPEKDALYGTLVKRVVGLPGERIHIGPDGRIYCNGTALDVPDFSPPAGNPGRFFKSALYGVMGWKEEPKNAQPGVYSQHGMYGVREQDEYSLVPAGHYLVMGDNSYSSRDGRFFGWLPNENIVGRVASIWWPITSWRDFTGFSATLWWRGTVGLILALFALRLFIGRTVGSIRRGGGHYVVSFVSMGLRVPFTRRWVARWREPQRGDLVLCAATLPEAADQEAMFIGRVAGLPGEKVRVEDGRLFVNDKRDSLPPVLAEMPLGDAPAQAKFGRGRAGEMVTVPEHCFFVLSEAEPDGAAATDSRALGWIPRNGVIGRVTWRWWPPGRA